MTAPTTTALEALVAVGLDALARGRAERGGPVPTGHPRDVAAAVAVALGHDPLPEVGVGEAEALAVLARVAAAGAADPDHPHCAAHLHCPPLSVAVAADLVATALNPSLDSWDQAPSTTVMEDHVVRALARLAGLPDGTGVLTTGGTESTITALLLARDAAPGPVRLYASELAHFSVDRAAHLLGLPPVVAVPVDADLRMDPSALAGLLVPGERAVVVATAGTTDAGAIDPLRDVAGVVRQAGGWLHVDAAYGGGALLSDRLAPLLDGLGEADSVSLDLHKLGWQPVAAGVLLVRDPASFAPLDRRAAYLNPIDDDEAGYPSLLGRSLRTTRRADVLKVAVTLRALGRRGLGARVDACHDLARASAALVQAHPALVLTRPPVLTTVLFRYAPADPARSDAVNAGLRRRLLREGAAVVGRTETGGAVHLKLTLLRPETTVEDVRELLDLVVAAGRAEEGAA